ncbi:F-box domain containing protein [Pandoravirus quercus]|uniref:F-box domain containing protein n=1 Tax=Pandoravirus quercus TaxID=2107709 RepID=A0A2U7U960_9VIRU|nr:F-box domain containing protein [Pandoravirus quercus]AVK74966.1 F-box domain containing protein [Pandoravirus quercus]
MNCAVDDSNGHCVDLFSLPDELLLHVASFFDQPTDLCAWSMVSARLALIGGDARLWRSLHERQAVHRMNRWRRAVYRALDTTFAYQHPHWRESIKRRGQSAVADEVVALLSRVVQANAWFAQAESRLADLLHADPRAACRVTMYVRASISPAQQHVSWLHKWRESGSPFVGTDIRIERANVTIRCGAFDTEGLLTGPGLYHTTDAWASSTIIGTEGCCGGVQGFVGTWSSGQFMQQDNALALANCNRIYRGQWGPSGPEGQGMMTNPFSGVPIVGTWHNGRLIAPTRAADRNDYRPVLAHR